MDKKTIVENGWMTDVAVACDDSVTMDSDLFKACVTIADVHELVWPNEESNGDTQAVSDEEQIDQVTDITGEPVEEEIPDPVVEEPAGTPEEEALEDETPEDETPVVDPEDEE